MAFGDFVQFRAASTTSTSLTLPNFASAVTEGNTILVAVMLNGEQEITVTDTLLHTYTEDSTLLTAGTYSTHIVRVSDITGGTNAVTVTCAIEREIYAIACEYEGNCAFDQVAADTGTGTSLSSGNTPTTSEAIELLFGVFHTPGTANTFTEGAGYTIRATQDTWLMVEDRKVSSTGTYAATATDDNGGAWGARIATYSDASPEAPTIIQSGFRGTLIVEY